MGAQGCAEGVEAHRLGRDRAHNAPCRDLPGLRRCSLPGRITNAARRHHRTLPRAAQLTTGTRRPPTDRHCSPPPPAGVSARCHQTRHNSPRRLGDTIPPSHRERARLCSAKLALHDSRSGVAACRATSRSLATVPLTSVTADLMSTVLWTPSADDVLMMLAKGVGAEQDVGGDLNVAAEGVARTSEGQAGRARRAVDPDDPASAWPPCTLAMTSLTGRARTDH